MIILITAPYNAKCRQELADLFGDIVYRPWKANGHPNSEQELMDLLSQTGADALITEHDRVTDKVLRTYPDLQFIGVCRGTPSNVSLETADACNIPVFNAPGRNAQAVAELFIGNVIGLLRHTMESCKWIKEGKWTEGTHRETSYLYFKGNELSGKTIGMVGFGAVARRIAEMVAGFPCHIQFYDPYVSSSNPDYEQTDLKNVFETSDIVSIHLPVNKETTEMIDKPLLSRMRSDAVFVNTARSAVIDMQALWEILNQKKIRGAVLDVFDGEPPTDLDSKIIQLPTVWATPHIAGATEEVKDHHSRKITDAIVDWWKGRT